MRKIVPMPGMPRLGHGWRTGFPSVAIYLLCAEMVGAASQQVAIAPSHGGQFVGSAGCKSSSCHGGAGEKRSQYITWTQQDFHARAYAVLVNARSARMAETLGLGQAQTSSRCTACHSPFQSVEPSRLTATAHIDEGVSCENCHNAAASWLRGHTRPDWTYSMRVTAGMRDLRNFYVRANTCVACHQNLDDDVAAAGHPDLRFELDGQSVAEPKHWQDDPSTGAKAWLVGQAVALREMSWALANTQNPGPESIAKWNGLVWLLGKVSAQQTQFPMIDAAGATLTHAEFIDMQQRADSMARLAAESGAFGADFARATLQTLANTGSEFLQGKQSHDLLFRRADRLVTALYRLGVAAGVENDTAPSPEIRPLLEAIQMPASFEPARFAKTLETYRDRLTNSGRAGH